MAVVVTDYMFWDFVNQWYHKPRNVQIPETLTVKNASLVTTGSWSKCHSSKYLTHQLSCRCSFVFCTQHANRLLRLHFSHFVDQDLWEREGRTHTTWRKLNWMRALLKGWNKTNSNNYNKRWKKTWTNQDLRNRETKTGQQEAWDRLWAWHGMKTAKNTDLDTAQHKEQQKHTTKEDKGKYGT